MSAGVLTAARLGFAGVGLTLASAAFGSYLSGQADAPAVQPAPQQAAAATADAARVQKGRDLFANWSCSSCHSLADAAATGHVGPAFDGDTSLSQAFVVDRVTNGQGAMPAFGGQMTDEEIADVAFYVTHVAKK